VVGVTVVMWLFGSRKPAAQPFRDADADQLLRQRVVLLRGPLCDEQANVVIAKLLFLQHETPRVPITLLIDSPGGSVIAAMAVIDTIKALLPPVRTRCDGSADGTAAIILACGQSGERVVVHGSAISLTPVIAASPGVANSDLNRTRQLLAAVIAESSGRNLESVEEDLVNGRSFDPLGAIEYGLADRVEE